MPKQVDHEQYRKQLLGKSFECFANEGYASMTMRELARHLNVSTGTLYHYFPSKQDLFEQLVDFLCNQDTRMASNLLLQPLNFNQQIEALFAFAAMHQDYFLKQTMIWMDFVRQHGLETALKSPAVDRYNKKSREWIGTYLGTNDQALITFVSCFLNGLLLEIGFTNPQVSFEEQGALFARMLRSHLHKED